MNIFLTFPAWFYPFFGTSPDFCTTKIYWNAKLNIFPGGLWSNSSIGIKIILIRRFLKLLYWCYTLSAVYHCQLKLTHTNFDNSPYRNNMQHIFIKINTICNVNNLLVLTNICCKVCEWNIVVFGQSKCSL